jgi:hypothetical protein
MVDRRWDEYNLGDFRKSPSLRLLPLVRSGGAAIEPANTAPV